MKLLSSCALGLGGRSPSLMFSVAQGPIWHVECDVEADDDFVEGILGAGGCAGVCGCLLVPKCVALRARTLQAHFIVASTSLQPY